MANKGQKGQIKGQTVFKLNLHIFLTCMGSFECVRQDFATVSKFQDKKGQMSVKLENHTHATFWPK